MLDKTVFFRATLNVKSLPKSIAEVILSGRSNVGKSSIVNALCSQKNLARISKMPGRTRSLNVYSVAMRRWIIDLPGYGFARADFKEKEIWRKIIEECIILRKNKKTVYIVIDAFLGPRELDFDMSCWLKKYNIPFKIIMNKYDKLLNILNEEEVKTKIALFFEIDKSYIFVVSAKRRRGFSELRNDIVSFLNC
ncbi:MAG: ribosome biogenesis GTP-binding protein YihA/YsxC [Endomicrobium sp.]|jgi:GTP-binding protein|nr:ribosome biogenesis GTP-binding protein YihA/YsxC [Endomicrobium sp.]